MANYSQRFTYYSSFLFPKFQSIILSNQPIILPLFSNSTMQPQQKLIAMTYAFKFNPKTTALHAVSKALQSSSCPFKVGISGYGNLQTMSTDKWATSKSTQLSTKVWVKLLLMRFCRCRVSYLNIKQTILPIIQKVMPIIRTLFSTKMCFLLLF